MAGSNNYKIIVSAEVNTSEIQKQLSTFGKTAKIKVDSSGVKQAAKDVGFLGVKWADAAKKFLAWKIIGDAFSGIERAITQMVTSVYELDTALTEFNKVTDLSETQLDKFIDKAYKAGEATAKTGREIIEASTEFAKSGFSADDSLALAKYATMYQNIADEEINAGEAAGFIVSQIKAFKMEAKDAEKIISAVNDVSNKYAVSSADLANNLGKVSATMAASGTSYEQTLGMMTAITEITRTAGKSANALKTISQRIRGVGEDGEDATEVTGKLQKKFDELGISIQIVNKETGDMASTYDIMTAIAGKWNSFNDSQRQALGELAAGKNRITEFNALMSNFGVAISATETAINSAGSAEKENAIVLESMKGKLQELKSAVENFSRKTLDSEFLKAIIDVGTALVKFADSDIGRLLTSIALFNVAILGTKKLLALDFFKNIISGVSSFVKIIKETGLSLNSLQLALQGTKLAFLSNPLFWGATATIAGIFAVVKVIDKFTISLQEQKQIVEDLTSKISGLKSEYDSLSTKSNLTSAEENRLALLTAEISANETLLVQEKKKEYARSNRKDISPIEFKGNENRTRSSDVGKAVKGETTKVFEQVKAYEELNSTKAESIEQDNKQKATKAELMASFIEEAKNLQETKDIIGNLTPEDEKLLTVLTALISVYNIQTKAVTENGIALNDVSNVVSEYASKLEELDEWQGKMADGASLSYSEMSKFKELYPELSKNIVRTNNGWTVEVGVLEDLRKQSFETVKATIEAERNKTLAAIGGTTSRVKAIALESKTWASFVKAMEDSGLVEKMSGGDSRASAERVKLYDSYLAFANLSTELEKLSEIGYESTVSGGKQQTEKKAKKEVDTWKSAFDAFYKDLQYRRNKDIISDEQYYDELARANQKYFANKKEYLDDFKKYDLEVYEYLKKKELEIEEEKRQAYSATRQDLEHDEFLSSSAGGGDGKSIEYFKQMQKNAHDEAQRLRDKGASENDDYLQELQKQWWDYQNKITSIQESEEEKRQENLRKQEEERQKTLLKYLENEKSKLEATLSIYEKYAEGRADDAQTEIDRLNEEKNSLQELNNEREDAIRLQELEDALAKAKTRQVRIYREGKGFVYEQDSIAVSDAQKNLEEYKRQESLKKEQTRIESEIKLWEEEKKKWSEVVSNYKEQQDLLLAEQISGISLEKLNHDARLENLKEFVKEYNLVNSELADVNTNISNVGGGSSGGKSTEDKIKEEMAKNSEKWHNATTDAEREALHKANVDLAKDLEGKFDPGSGKWTFANGTDNYQGGALIVGKNVGEHGREIITPPKGSGIIPNPLTERLMDFGKNPLEFLSNIIRRPSFDRNSNGQSVVENYNISNVNVNANNANEFLSSIKALAIQRTANRK